MLNGTVLDPPAEAEFVERLASIDDLSEHGDHLARYRFSVQFVQGARVLDLCCGIGYGSFLMAAAGAKEVRGLDVSEDALNAAKGQPLLPNLRFDYGDVCATLPEPGTWDFVNCFEGVEHVPDPAKLLENIYAALKPGGLAVVSTPNADAYGGHSGNPFHISEMSEAQYRAYIGKYPWKVQWYAQIGEWIWSRPKWQQSLIETAKRLKGGGASETIAGGLSQPDTEGSHSALDVDAGYPMPWKRALSISPKPPTVIIAVCQKPF